MVVESSVGRVRRWCPLHARISLGQRSVTAESCRVRHITDLRCRSSVALSGPRSVELAPRRRFSSHRRQYRARHDRVVGSGRRRAAHISRHHWKLRLRRGSGGRGLRHGLAERARGVEIRTLRLFHRTRGRGRGLGQGLRRQPDIVVRTRRGDRSRAVVHEAHGLGDRGGRRRTSGRGPHGDRVDGSRQHPRWHLRGGCTRRYRRRQRSHRPDALEFRHGGLAEPLGKSLREFLAVAPGIRLRSRRTRDCSMSESRTRPPSSVRRSTPTAAAGLDEISIPIPPWRSGSPTESLSGTARPIPTTFSIVTSCTR